MLFLVLNLKNEISAIAVAWSLQAILGFLIIQTLGLEMPVLIKQ